MEKKFFIIVVFILFIFILSSFKEKNIWDEITEERINGLHPKIRKRVLRGVSKLEKKGIFIRVVSGMRTFEEQAVLYNQGRTTAGNIVTNARAGESYHNYGLAFDVVVMEDKTSPNFNSPDIYEVAKVFKSLGFEWGGDWSSFVDRPHFQDTFGSTTSELRRKIENGETDRDGFVKV